MCGISAEATVESREMAIGPALVKMDLIFLFDVWWRRYDTVPMVGCPAKGISAWEVNMSISTCEESVGGSCKNTVSDRLNSDATRCFCS